MPVARGIMQLGRINVWPTSTAFTVSPPSPVSCGTPISCNVTVTNNGANVPPVGYAAIVDLNTSMILAFATVSAAGPNYSTVVLSPSITSGNLALAAKYLGQDGGPDLAHQFKPSISPTQGYSVNLIAATTTITSPVADGYFCYHAALPITAHVVQGATPITSGNVSFVLWANASAHTNLGISSLNGSGDATFNMPADMTTPPGPYYLEAIFDGTGCFTPSSSGSGVSGRRVFPSTNDTTSTSISLVEADPFCISQPSHFSISVVPSHLIGPSIGTINVNAVLAAGGTPFSLGSGTPTNGLLVITVPALTFPTSGAYNVTASYTGDGYCYQSSNSSAIAVHPTYFTTITYVLGGPHTACAYINNTYSFQVNSVNGQSISGTLSIYAGPTLVGTTPISGPSGIVTYYTIPAYSFTPGSTYVNAIFNSDGTNCQGNSTSPAYAVTAQGTTSPSVSLALDHNSGYYTDTLILTGTVYHNGGVASLNSSVYWEYYDPALTYHVLGPYTFTDTGDPSHATYTFTGLPGGVGTYSFFMYYSGNNCYAAETTSGSSATQFNAGAPIH